MRARTSEQIARDVAEEMGRALSGAFEGIMLRLTAAVATVHEENAELRDEVNALANRIEGVVQLVNERTAPHA